MTTLADANGGAVLSPTPDIEIGMPGARRVSPPSSVLQGDFLERWDEARQLLRLCQDALDSKIVELSAGTSRYVSAGDFPSAGSSGAMEESAILAIEASVRENTEKAKGLARKMATMLQADDAPRGPEAARCMAQLRRLEAVTMNSISELAYLLKAAKEASTSRRLRSSLAHAQSPSVYADGSGERELLRERDGLRNSLRMLDDLAAQGETTNSTLSSTRRTLASTARSLKVFTEDRLPAVRGTISGIEGVFRRHTTVLATCFGVCLFFTLIWLVK